ncbi:LuxR C-terminal-related transcriptional regulator [Vibrio sp. RC27]
MIIKTKLYCPVLKSNAIARPILTERLGRALDIKLTLVSAPAGFGKTQLVASWCAEAKNTICWVSLDSKDKNTDTFVTYLIAAIREMDSTLVLEAWNLVQAGNANHQHVITSLTNELTYYSDQITIVLDDYHLVESLQVNELMNALIEQLPHNVHIVLITRSDPTLALAKLRASGELLEIRSSDLRFSDDEANEYLKLNTTADLNRANIVAVNHKAEGWAVGLQLSSLLFSNSDTIEEIVSQFTGSNTFVLDYLTEEVIANLPNSIRHFLLETSILSELSVELCNAVLDIDNSAEHLSYLEQNNVFLIPLDNQKTWFRYHHLFADALMTRAQMTTERREELNWRIATWYADRGRLSDAISYAFATRNTERALELIETHWPQQRADGHDSILVEWLSNIDIDVIQKFPVLAGYYALAMLYSNPEKGMYLLDTTRIYFENLTSRFTPQENTAFGIVNIGEAYIHAAQGNTEEVLLRVRNAQAVLPFEEQVWRGSSRALEGIALWRQGNIEKAEDCLKAAVANMDHSNDLSAQITSRFLLGDYYYQLGWLNKAKKVAETAVTMNEQHSGYTVEGSADVYLLLGEIVFEQGDIVSAQNLLDIAKQFGVLGFMPEARYRYLLIEGRIALAQGQDEQAQRLFYEADQCFCEPPNPCHRPPSFWLKLYQLNKGNSTSVTQTPPFELSVSSHSYSYLLYMLAEPTSRLDVQQALHSLPLNRSFPCLLFTQKISEVLNAVEAKNSELVRETFDRLILIQQEHQNTIWMSEIGPIRELIELNQINVEKPNSEVIETTLLDPLSTKETEVLKWLDTELTGPQIASKLFVSLNTFRTHTKSIYSKLDVSNRRAAINKARQYQILN